MQRHHAGMDGYDEHFSKMETKSRQRKSNAVQETNSSTDIHCTVVNVHTLQIAKL